MHPHLLSHILRRLLTARLGAVRPHNTTGSKSCLQLPYRNSNKGVATISQYERSCDDVKKKKCHGTPKWGGCDGCGSAAQAVNPFPESQLFQRLVAAERDADALLADHRAEAAACLAPPATATKKLRVYIFATHTNQAPTAGAASSAPAAGPATATAPPPGAHPRVAASAAQLIALWLVLSRML